MLVVSVQQQRMLTTLLRTDYYNEDGEPPVPYTFEELARKHHAQFRNWFRVDSPK